MSGSGTGQRATGRASGIGALAVKTITAAANASGITSVDEGSETISDRLKPDLPRLEYTFLDEKLEEVRTGLAAAKRNLDKELRKRRKFRWVFSLRVLIAAETEAAAENFYKMFLRNLPKHVLDGDGMDVAIAPHRAERRGFSRNLIEVFPKKEIAVFVTVTGGIYTDEEVDLIKEVNINPEVQ